MGGMGGGGGVGEGDGGQHHAQSLFTEICKERISIVIDESVLELEVSINDVQTVQILQHQHCRPSVKLCRGFRQILILFEYL